MRSKNPHKPTSKNRTEVSFRLEQKQVDHKIGGSFEPIIRDMANAFQVNLNLSKHNKGIEYFLVRVINLDKLDIIIKYMDRFPLFSSKRLDFET